MWSDRWLIISCDLCEVWGDTRPLQAMPGLSWPSQLTPEVRRLWVLTPGTGEEQRGAECGAGTVLCFMSSPTLSTAGTVTRQHGKCITYRRCIVSRLPALIVCSVIAFCDILPTLTHHTSVKIPPEGRHKKQGHFNFEKIQFWLPQNVMMGFQLIFRMGFKVYYHRVPMLHPPHMNYARRVGSEFYNM